MMLFVVLGMGPKMLAVLCILGAIALMWASIYLFKMKTSSAQPANQEIVEGSQDVVTDFEPVLDRSGEELDAIQRANDAKTPEEALQILQTDYAGSDMTLEEKIRADFERRGKKLPENAQLSLRVCEFNNPESVLAEVGIAESERDTILGLIRGNQTIVVVHYPEANKPDEEYILVCMNGMTREKEPTKEVNLGDVSEFDTLVAIQKDGNLSIATGMTNEEAILFAKENNLAISISANIDTGKFLKSFNGEAGEEILNLFRNLKRKRNYSNTIIVVTVFEGTILGRRDGKWYLLELPSAQPEEQLHEVI